MVRVAHGLLHYDDLTSGNRGVTGSEQSMLFTAAAQAEQGHQVSIYCPTDKPGFARVPGWQGERQTVVEMIDSRVAWPRMRKMDNSDVAIAWLCTSSMYRAPASVLRVLNVQINDWDMNDIEGFESSMDGWVAVSEQHKAHLLSKRWAPERTPMAIVPNGIDLRRFTAPETRVPLRCVYTSSPDRGLHWLLSIWPDIKYTYPEAELHIFYEVEKWAEAVKRVGTEMGLRARYILEKTAALQSKGVQVYGAVPPVALARALLSSDLLLYPCDTVSFTEGFGVSVMESCAAGVVPVLTDADSLGEIYGESGAVLVPRGNTRAWLDNYLQVVLKLMGNREEIERRRGLVQAFAQQYDWPIVAKAWNQVLQEFAAAKA